MLFNSLQFIIFLPCVIILYYALPHKIRWSLLLVASYYFYMVWKPEYIILIIISTLVDYFASILMEKQTNKKRRKLLLFASLFVNLGLLFVFKYFNFFNGVLGQFYSLLASKAYPIVGVKLLLPIGISFYTFQTLSYSVDVYRGRRKAERHLGYFALYVTFFPQLVAGPIERSDRLIPQLKAKHKFNYEDMMSSILRICWGMFKKVVIADRVAVIVNTIYSNLPNYSGVYLIIATLGFAVQIYCDFSAYSDIAIGSAKLMGIDLIENFKMPYFSKSISEFWNRWHISLSTWFKDYLYIPLGGNRMKKQWRVYLNLLIVFVVSGLWHGANWTFLAWGFLHGFYQTIERLIRKIPKRFAIITIPKEVKQIFVFILVSFAWIFFRANSMHAVAYILININFNNFYTLFNGHDIFALGLDNKDIWLLVISIIWLTSSDAIRYKNNNHQLITGYFKQGLASILLIFFIIIFGYYGSTIASEFIYFQF